MPGRGELFVRPFGVEVDRFLLGDVAGQLGQLLALPGADHVAVELHRVVADGQARFVSITC